MSQLSGFWTTSATPTGHQQTGYTQAHWSQAARILAACSGFEGVAPAYEGGLEVSVGAGTSVDVAAGGAVVDGKWYESTAVENLSITPPASGTRYDRVFLRAAWSSYQVTLVYVEGGDNPPTPENSPGTLYDLQIAQVSVTSGGTVTIVADEREWARPAIDESTLDDVDGVLQVPDGGIDTPQLADDSVDDTKAGNRVPQFYRRQGGSATDWSTPGATSRTPGAVRMQGGVKRWSGTAASSGYVGITFPVSFSYKPIVIATVAGDSATDRNVTFDVGDIGANGAELYWETTDGTTKTYIDFHWLAIGPE